MDDEEENKEEITQPEDEEEAQFLSFSKAENQQEMEQNGKITEEKDLFADSDYQEDN